LDVKKVGVFEGKTHFSALIDEASRGETIVVTKNGRPLAKIVPFGGEAETAASAMDALLASEATLGPGLTLEQLVDEGRRY
jgi:prevent-host-death family protein